MFLGFTQIRVGGHHDKDYSILGSTLGSPILRNYH